MLSWRSAALVVVSFSLPAVGNAQTYKLAEANLDASAFRIELNMALEGEISVQQDGKTLKIKRLATAQHEYFERLLSLGTKGIPDKSARYYKTAKVIFDDGEEKSQRTFRPERAFVVCQRVRDRLLCYSPKGPFSHDEVELTEHFDTLAISGLLPAKEVAVGEVWKLSSAAAQYLCSLEGLEPPHDLSAKLERVDGKVAHISLAGTVKGIELGAQVKLDIKGALTFDFVQGCVTRIDWTQHDERQQGPVTPAFKADVKLSVVRTLLTELPAEINDLAVVPVPQGEVPEHLTQLTYSDYKERFHFQHGRAWQMVAPTDEHVVLRLIDRGDFVAQATITPWKKVAAGQHLSAEEFHDAMVNAPAWEQTQELEKVKKIEDTGANQVFRYAAEGTLDGTRVVQYYYLVVGEQGDQMVVTFTMTPAQAPKLGSQDLTLVRSITFSKTP